MDFAIVFQISVYRGDLIFWVNLSLTNALLRGASDSFRHPQADTAHRVDAQPDQKRGGERRPLREAAPRHPEKAGCLGGDQKRLKRIFILTVFSPSIKI